MRRLKEHMLSRLLKLAFNGDERTFTPEQCNELCLLNVSHIVESKILHINYTSYDIHRGYNALWPDGHSFLMTLSREEDPNCHPFWYCRVWKSSGSVG